MKLTLVKLGGGLIAPKDWPAHTADIKAIRRLGREIREYWRMIETDENRGLIIGHGGGNFPHTEAVKYETHKGFSDERGKLGACLTQAAARNINSIVMREFLKLGLPVAAVAPHDIWVTDEGKLAGEFYEPIRVLLGKRILPVVYGDVVGDETRGSVIFSTEKCLGLLARNFETERVIQVSSEDGVLDSEGRVIEEIGESSFNQLKQDIGGADGVDVTGGMLHKVEESLQLAKELGIETLIISGRKAGRLKQALQGIKVAGTRIH